MSWTNKLLEKDVDSHSSDSKSDKVPDLPHHGPNNSKSTKKDDHNPSQKTQVVKIHMVHDRITQLEEDETEPTQVILGLSPTIQPMNEPCVSTAVSRTPTETKEIEKEEAKILLAVRRKNPKDGTGNVGTMIYTRDVVDEAGVSSHHVALEPSPPKFDASSK